MMNPVHIRKATLRDIETLLQFEQGVILAERPFDDTLKEGHIHYYDICLLLEAEHSELLVAERNGEVIGCGYARIESSVAYTKHSQHAKLGFMYVVPAFRGQGINKRIMQALLQWVATKDVLEVRLNVYSQNESAIKAYRKIGFSDYLQEMRLSIKAPNSSSHR